MNNNICIVRNTFGDRYAFLKLSLEYQEKATRSEKFSTYIFIDPHPEFGFSNEYLYIKHKKIVFKEHKERQSWYLAVDHIFSNFDYDYIISIEDDVIISQDYLKLCEQIVSDKFLEENKNLLYFHIGAWEKPFGDPNRILPSSASSRSILISRKKFNIIKKFVSQNNVEFKKGNDNIIKEILDQKKMITIAPQFNRHGHFGVYGWSSLGKHRNMDGKDSLFDKCTSQEEIYNLIKQKCLSGKELLELNLNKNPRYFWDFDPNIDFDTLVYPKF